MSDVEKRLKELVAKILKVDLVAVTDEARFVEELGAQSIQSIELIAAFEEEFNLEIDDEQASGAKTVGKAVEFIENLL